MKKILLSVAVVLIIVWAGATWYVGRQTEPSLQQYLDETNKQYASYGMTQEIVSYESGFLRSRAITKATFTTAPFDEIIGDVQFTNNIYNGPVFFGGSSPVKFGIAYISTRLDLDSLDKDKREWLAKVFSDEQPFYSLMFINFDGTVDYSLSVNPMEFDMDDATFTVDGVTIKGDADADMLGDFSMQAGTIVANMDASRFTIPSLEASGTLTGIVAGQALGSFSASMPQVSIKQHDSPAAFIFDAEVETNSDVAGSDAEGTFSLVVDNIQGAAGILNSLDYAIEYEGMKIEGFEAIRKISRDMANLDWDEEALETPEGVQKMQELMAEYPDRFITAVFRDLLQTGKSRMRHVVMVESPGGQANADIDLTYTGKGTPRMQDLVNYGPDDWAAMMRGTIELDVDRSMLPQPFVMLLGPTIQQGIIAEDGSKLKARLELAGENIILNGTSMPLSDLLQMLTPPKPENTAGGTAGAGPDIPEDIMLKIQQEGMTPEVLQLIEERDDVPPETKQMFRQIQQMQQEMEAGNMPE